MTTDLDTFETALLAELRTVVADRRPQRRARTLTLGGLAASVAAAVGIGLAVGGSSPAFAVEKQADGDVVVTVHRFDDADGLERALADQGVTADVDYAKPMKLMTTDGRSLDVIPIPDRRKTARVVIQRGVPEGESLDCSFGKGGYVTLDSTSDGYVLTIPRASILAKTPLHITTAGPKDHGTLAVSYYDDQCIQVAAPSNR
ncbi:hypothetical protein [Aeromicrobium terrae]|uniref:Uncharacterized protein n=1 Tax=Aeromicrobium terrae TaxID=2498846 RepID=A0A5C8NI76_9ACTN|nr:hypothetical protein [Aeromicrobium terrae]TXL60796.1 hypothetical protein FHP06_10250 [Aeromicrobium terrae]